MLDRQVIDERIRFPEGLEQDMKAKVTALAREAFSVLQNVQPLPSSSNSSSSRSHPQSTSLLSGSYAHIHSMSTPQTTIGGQRRQSASRSAPSQTYSLDSTQVSPTDNQMILQSRQQRPIMGPPPSTSNLRQIQQSYSDMQSQSPNVTAFAIGMPMEYPQYPAYGNNSGPNSTGFFPIYPPSFDASATTFTGGAVATNYSGVPDQGMNQDMLDAPTSARDWELDFRRLDST